MWDDGGLADSTTPYGMQPNSKNSKIRCYTGLANCSGSLCRQFSGLKGRFCQPRSETAQPSEEAIRVTVTDLKGRFILAP